MRVTWRDDKAPHQIRLFTHSGNGTVYISCTCRISYRSFTPGVPSFEPMGSVYGDEDPWRIYDDPKLHRVNQGVVFNPGDRTETEVYFVK